LRVLIFEPNPHGHHFMYLSFLVPALRELGAEAVIATSRGASRTEEYRQFLQPLEGRFSLDDWMEQAPSGMLASAWRQSGDLGESTRRARPDWVYLPYADAAAQGLGLRRLLSLGRPRRGVQIEGLMMRGGFAYPGNGFRRRAFLAASWRLAAVSPMDFVHLLDPLVYEAVRRAGGRLAARCGLMPEPIEASEPMDRVAARGTLGLPQTGRLLACAGLIDSRKGCDLLVRAFARAAMGPQDRLLFVGRHDDRVRALLTGPYAELVRLGRIISIDRFVSSRELEAALWAADAIAAVYPGHVGSASIVIRAAAAGRPVIGSSDGWIGWAISTFELGEATDPANIDSLGAAMTRVLDRAHGYAVSARAARWLEYHTPRNFAQAWTRRLRERLGLPGSTDQRSWDWVMADERGPRGGR
jgi:glycosyltransferase involved in cell wall biosynthesis